MDSFLSTDGHGATTALDGERPLIRRNGSVPTQAALT